MSLLTLWAIFGYYIFFSTKAIYMFFVSSGAGFPSLFLYWTAGAAISIIYFCMKSGALRKRQGVIIALGVIFGIALYISKERAELVVKAMSDTLNYYILWSFPALLIGIMSSKRQKAKLLEPSIDSIVLLFWIALTLSYIKSGGSRHGINLGGASYQNYSYCASYGLLLDLYMIVYADKTKLSKIFRSRPYKVVRIVFIPMFFIYQVAGGGRGALVLTCVGISIVIIDMGVINRKWIQLTVICAVIAVGLFLLMPVIQNNGMLNEQFTRATAFIDDEGSIDLENGSSGRDKVYEMAMEDIKKHPFLGYGPMGQLKERHRYCHNLYLDVLYEGGLVYFAVWVVLTVGFIIRFIHRIRQNEDDILFLFLFSCVFMVLMFSAYYPMQGGLWYFIGYLFGAKPEKSDGKLTLSFI